MLEVDVNECPEQDAEAELDLKRNVFLQAGKWVIIVMAALNIIKEMFQFYQVSPSDLESNIHWWIA